MSAAQSPPDRGCGSCGSHSFRAEGLALVCAECGVPWPGYERASTVEVIDDGEPWKVIHGYTYGLHGEGWYKLIPGEPDNLLRTPATLIIHEKPYAEP